MPTIDPKTGFAIDPAQYGPTLAVTPPAAAPAPFVESNPLGLNAAGPGYLPPELRQPRRDPDMQVGGYTPTGLGQPNLTPDEINANNAALQRWGDMDKAYWTPREQDPTPILLGALGVAAAPFALSALGIGAGAGAAGGLGAGGVGATGAGLAAAAPGLGALGAGGVGVGTTVSELVVTAAASGMTIPAIAAAVGIPAATVGTILANSGGSNALTGSQGADTVSPTTTVDPLTVTAPAQGSGLTAPLAAGAGLAGLGLIGAGGGGSTPPVTTVDPLTVNAPAANPGPLTTAPTAVASAPGASGLVKAVTSGDPSQVADWVKNYPLQAAALGLTVAGALTGSKGAGSGSYSIPTGDSAPGTRGSLDPIFSASLPAPTNAPMVRSALPQVDWNRYAIEGPAQSFFSNVPQSPPAQFSVLTPAQVKQRAADKFGVADIAALRKKFAGPGYAKGGDVAAPKRTSFAVSGPGTGRSDDIDAKLSDGEYVMDAETVAMLGDGSSKAGAAKLDKLRVNLRKAKGKQLARGRISVSARDPETYMAGGRV